MLIQLYIAIIVVLIIFGFFLPENLMELWGQLIALFIVLAPVAFVIWCINDYIKDCMKTSKNKLDIDEKIPVENYKKAQKILNSIDFNHITKSEIHVIIDKLAEIDGSEFSTELKNVEFHLLKSSLIEWRDAINSMDLNSKDSISTRELYKDQLSDEQMEHVQRKYNEGRVDYREDDNSEENFEEVAEMGILTSFFIEDKNERIKKKREQVAKLEREHSFQRHYLPYWDSEERLYDKNKDDEESYLDAKIIELEAKNLSHDMYLTEEEKEIYEDDTDGGIW